MPSPRSLSGASPVTLRDFLAESVEEIVFRVAAGQVMRG